MSHVDVLDEHYLGLSALVTVGLQLACFAIANTFKFDTITDFAGAMNFVLLAFLSYGLGGGFSPRQTAMTVCLTVTRVELGVFLLFRVCKRSKDARFDEMRENTCRFLGFWIFQMIWVFFVSLPVVFVNGAQAGPPLGPWDHAGLVLFSLGFVLQVAADVQKYRFRADAANRGKVCDVGVWKWSRHPNYAGEIVLWLGIWLMGVPVYAASEGGLGWMTVLSPVLTYLILMHLSGIPYAEGKALERFYRTAESAAAFEQYRFTTSPMVPVPPGCYYLISAPLRRIFLCEYDSYAYTGPYPDGFTPAAQGERGGLTTKKQPSYAASPA